jgi:multidrug resistance efflux pump
MNANAAPAAPAPANGNRTRILILIAVIFIVSGLLWGAYWYLVLSNRERTDDAYVNGNKVVISAQISCTVIVVLADDTQLVKAGQVLVRLDPVDAETSLSRTASSLAQTVRQVRQEKSTATNTTRSSKREKWSWRGPKLTSQNASRCSPTVPLRRKKCATRARASNWRGRP